MALADVDICNLGLSYIGETDFLEAIGEDSTAGEVAEKVYEPTLEEVLRDLRPKFANRVWMPAALAVSGLATTIVPDQWAYAFVYPADCIFLRGLYPGVRNPREDQRLEQDITNDANAGKIILADVAQPTLLGTALVTDTGQFPADFREALAWKLGFKFATSIRKDIKGAQAAWAGYLIAKGNATGNANQEIHLARPTPAHITARR